MWPILLLAELSPLCSAPLRSCRMEKRGRMGSPWDESPWNHNWNIRYSKHYRLLRSSSLNTLPSPTPSILILKETQFQNSFLEKTLYKLGWCHQRWGRVARSRWDGGLLDDKRGRDISLSSRNSREATYYLLCAHLHAQTCQLCPTTGVYVSELMQYGAVYCHNKL